MARTTPTTSPFCTPCPASHARKATPLQLRVRPDAAGPSRAAGRSAWRAAISSKSAGTVARRVVALVAALPGGELAVPPRRGGSRGCELVALGELAGRLALVRLHIPGDVLLGAVVAPASAYVEEKPWLGEPSSMIITPNSTASRMFLDLYR